MKSFIKKENIKYIILILVFSLLLFSSFGIAAPGEITVHFINVGKGDAILIQSQEVTILIDGGGRWAWVVEKVVSYLSEQGVKTIDAIVSTHPDTDHIGGLLAVIKKFQVKAVYDSGKIHTSKTFEDYLLLIDEKEITYYTPRRGETLNIGDLELLVLHPVDDVEQYSLNNASIVLRLEYGNISFLFTGDAGRRVEQEILHSGLPIKSTVLKVGHHGTKTSSSGAFLNQVNPEVAVIQVWKALRFFLPHPKVLCSLKSRGIKVYRNDLHGTVVISTDGNQYWVEVEEKTQPRAPPVDKDDKKININTGLHPSN